MINAIPIFTDRTVAFTWGYVLGTFLSSTLESQQRVGWLWQRWIPVHQKFVILILYHVVITAKQLLSQGLHFPIPNISDGIWRKLFLGFLRSQCDSSVFFLSMYCLNTEASKILGDACGATRGRCLGPESLHGKEKGLQLRKSK